MLMLTFIVQQKWSNTYYSYTFDMIRLKDLDFNAARPLKNTWESEVTIRHWRNSPGELWLQREGYVNSAWLKWLLILCSCEISTDSFNNFNAQPLRFNLVNRQNNQYIFISISSWLCTADFHFQYSLSQLNPYLWRFSLLPSILGFVHVLLFYPYEDQCFSAGVTVTRCINTLTKLKVSWSNNDLKDSQLITWTDLTITCCYECVPMETVLFGSNS